MSKDKFEIEIGAQLRNAEAPVPAGSWNAIKANIVNKPGASISPAGPIVGLVAGIALLASLAIYSNTAREIKQPVAEVAVNELQTKLPKVSEKKNAELNTISADSQVAAKVDHPLIDETHVATIKVISNPVSENKESVSENRQKNINFQPISKNELSEIDSHKVKSQEVRNLVEDKGTKENDATPASANSIPVKAKISASKTVGYAPLHVQFHNNGTGQRYYWEFGSVAESSDKEPEVVFEEPGVYTVNLSASNAEGDMSQDFMQITVKEGSSFYIPNSFSPNGDGLNDTYEVGSAKNIKSFYLVVTDDKGKTVFQTQNVNEPWNYDQVLHGRSDTQYFVSYRAVGVDGKVYTQKLQPINIVF